jgi:hypothetical protein
MRALPLPRMDVLASGLLLGVLGDVLLRAPGAPGLNLFLWAAAVAVVTVLLHRRGGGHLSGESAAWLAVGVLFTGTMLWRDSEALKVFALGCAVLAFALPAFRAGVAWVRASSPAEVLVASASGAAHGVFGAVLVLFGPDDPEGRQSRPRVRWRHAAPTAAVARGVAIAIPLILVFGGLFVAADSVFAAMIADTVRLDIDVVASHIVLTGFLAWLASGYLRGFLAGTDHPLLATVTRPRPLLGLTETATALGLVQLLFLLFVIVQFRYLFGGSGMVEVTPGLTYAEYARRGFFELVAVVALSLPMLLAADALLQRGGRRDEVVFRVLAGLHIALVFAVMASAVQRLRLYQDAYGLTVQRFHATALLILLAVVLLWFALTVLRGNRHRFAFGAIVAAFATVAVLHAVNPDAMIARTNVARMHEGAVGAAMFDASYAASLSADAIPVLLARLPELPEAARCVIAKRMLMRWPPDARVPLRSWNWSSARAHRMIREHALMLHGAGGCREAEAPAEGAAPFGG